MKKHWFLFIPEGVVPSGEIDSVMQASLEEDLQGFHKERAGCQLICWRAAEGLIQSPQPIDRYVQLFMNPQPLGVPLRLFDLYVKYYGVLFPYDQVRVVQDPAGIFCPYWENRTGDVPVDIMCHPQEQSVTLSAQIIEPESLAECRKTFLTLQQQVETVLVTAAWARDGLQRYLQTHIRW